MKYSPKLPEKNDNISSERHPLLELSIMLVSLTAIFLVVFWLLIFFVDRAVKSISMADEAKVYTQISQLWNFDLIENTTEPELKALVDQLAACTDIPYPIIARVIDDEDVNAVALPGGNVLLFSGLFKVFSSENGLAFVLAHELGHFINRDHLRGMGRSVVLMALSVSFTGANSHLSKWLTPTGHFGQAQYSQQAEAMADQTALKILNCHYGHVGGATEFFDWLMVQEQSPNQLQHVSHYFSTHPELKKRIEMIHKFSNTNGFHVGKVKLMTDKKSSQN